jgi:hypothetical protein
VRAAPRPPPARWRPPWKQIFAGLLGVGLIAGVAAGGAALYGQIQVRALGAEVERAEALLAQRMDEALHLRDELATLGADRSVLDASFAAWARTRTEPERAQLALDFVALAEDTAARYAPIETTVHEAQQVRARLSRLREARDDLTAVRRARAAADLQPSVQLAQLVGLVP